MEPAPLTDGLTAAGLASPDIAERTRRRVTRRLVPYLLLLYLIAYIDRTNIGVAKLQMVHDLNFTDAIVGLGAGIFFLGYFLLEIPGTLIVERWSARKWIARIMVSWGVVATLMGFIGLGAMNVISPKWQFYTLRLVLGLAEAGFFPGVIVYLSHWFRYADRGKAKSRFLIGIPLSSIIGVPLSQAIMANVNWYGLPGWRWVFILEGVPSVILGVVTFFYLTDRPHQAKWLPEDEKQWLTDELQREREQKQATGHASLWEGFRHPQVRLLVFVYLFAVTANYGLTFFIPSITNAVKGSSVIWQTSVSVLPYICMLFGMLYNGPASDRRRERRWHTAVPILLTGVGFTLCVLAGDNLGLMVFALCLSGAAPSAWPAFWPLPSAHLTGAAAAAAVGLINSVGNLGGFLGPYVVGYLKTSTGSFKAPLLFMAVCALIAGLLATRIKQPKKH